MTHFFIMTSEYITHSVLGRSPKLPNAQVPSAVSNTPFTNKFETSREQQLQSTQGSCAVISTVHHDALTLQRAERAKYRVKSRVGDSTHLYIQNMATPSAESIRKAIAGTPKVSSLRRRRHITPRRQTGEAQLGEDGSIEKLTVRPHNNQSPNGQEGRSLFDGNNAQGDIEQHRQVYPSLMNTNFPTLIANSACSTDQDANISLRKTGSQPPITYDERLQPPPLERGDIYDLEFDSILPERDGHAETPQPQNSALSIAPTSMAAQAEIRPSYNEVVQQGTGSHRTKDLQLHLLSPRSSAHTLTDDLTKPSDSEYFPIARGEKLGDAENQQSDGDSLDSKLGDIGMRILLNGNNDNLRNTVLHLSLTPKRHWDARIRDANNETDADSDIVSRKKRTNRRKIPKSEASKVRKSASRELDGSRISKPTNSTLDDHPETGKRSKKRSKPIKKKRRLPNPDKELMIISERLYDTNSDSGDDIATELWDDPIAPLSEGEGHVDRKGRSSRSALNLKIKFGVSNDFGSINNKQFRFPEPHILSPRSKRRQQRVPFHNDGFERQEADPIGILMPMQQAKRRKNVYQRITLRMGELTIVAEKPSGDGVKDVSEKRRKRRRKLRPNGNNEEESLSPGGAEVPREHEGGTIPFEEKNSGLEVHHFNETEGYAEGVSDLTSIPEDDTDNVSIDINFSSKGKSYIQRPASSLIDVAANKNTYALQQSPSTNIITQVQTVSQHLRAASTEIKAQKQRDKDLQISQELMMVSVPRSFTRSAEDDDNDDGDDNEEDGDSARESVNENSSTSESEADDNEGTEEVELQDESMEPEAEAVKSYLTIADIPDEDIELDPGKQTQAESRTNAGRELSPNSTVRQATTETSKTISNLEYLEVIASQALRLAPQTSPSRGSPVATRSAFDSGEPCFNYRRTFMEKPSESDTTKGQMEKDFSTAKQTMHSNPDEPWRPRIPDQSSISVELDDDIVDSRTHVAIQVRTTDSHHNLYERRSRLLSQPLNIVNQRPTSPQHESFAVGPYGSQTSVILGEPEGSRYQFRIEIPETQHTESLEDSHGRDSQHSFVLESKSYLDRASQILTEPVRSLRPSRTQSMPAYTHIMPQRGNPFMADGVILTAQKHNPLMAGGVTRVEAFQHTPSPIKASYRVSNLTEGTLGGGKSLKSLTRQASLGMGTMSGSPRKRMVSLSFDPPFRGRAGG